MSGKYFSICFSPPTAACVPVTSHKLLPSINVGSSGVMAISQSTEWILYIFECNYFDVSTIIYPHNKTSINLICYHLMTKQGLPFI